MTNIQTNTYYKDDMIIKETIVDGDIFEIKELYLDEEGEVVYEYTHDYATNQLLRIRKELLDGANTLDYYGIPGMLKQISAEERRRQIEKEKEEERIKKEKERIKKEKELKKQKNREQYNKKINKKLEKNRKRG